MTIDGLWHTCRTLRMRMRADDVLEGRLMPDLDATKQNAEEAIDLFCEVTEGQRVPSVTVFGSIRSADFESRKVFQHDPRLASTLSCLGIVVESPVARVIGTVLVKINRPAFPIALFSNFDEALAWAKQSETTSSLAS